MKSSKMVTVLRPYQPTSMVVEKAGTAGLLLLSSPLHSLSFLLQPCCHCHVNSDGKKDFHIDRCRTASTPLNYIHTWSIEMPELHRKSRREHQLMVSSSPSCHSGHLSLSNFHVLIHLNPYEILIATHAIIK